MKPHNATPTRREFLTSTAIAATSLSLGASSLAQTAPAGPVAASDKVRVGFIGVGNRGSQLLAMFMAQPDVEVAALCDIYEPYLQRDPSRVHPRFREGGAALGRLIPAMGEPLGSGVKRFKDYRALLDQKDIDAVCIATPDHWHAIQTVDALKAGKDIYVEKPLTATIREGRMMVDAQAASRQVVAVGLNRRGNPVYQQLAREIPAGKIGKVTIARAARVSNMFPSGIGWMGPETPPADFDWDMWLGPRAYRPYQYNIAPYRFRWWSDYSSQMGNWGVHYLDVIRWMLGEQAPIAISASGGKYAVDDDRDIPDTMEVTFEFASRAMAVFGIYEASGTGLFPFGEIELRGTKGTLHCSQNGYRVTPAKAGQFQAAGKAIEPEESAPGDKGGDVALVRDFVACVKSRRTPLCPLEEGHRSTCFAHLANIALKLGRRLEWDARAERFTNSEEANRHLHYEYRKPWAAHLA